MYDYKKCVIGLAPTRRDMFRKSRRDEIVKKSAELADRYGVDLVTIDGVTDEGLLVSNGDAEKAAKHFMANGVDAVFAPHANFGQEEAVAKLCAGVNKPVLLWGPRDPAPLGIVNQGDDRPYDVQCGLFATGKALLSYNVPFTYIENCDIDSPIIAEGFSDFARTVCAAKAFRNTRVGQLSLRPRQFLTVKYNESELLEKFGIEVVPIAESEIVGAIKQVLENDLDEAEAKIAAWNDKLDFSAIGDDAKTNLAAASIGITRLAKEYGCTILAGECWRMLRSAFGISSCFLWGALTEDGLAVTCETDVLGAVGTGMLMGALRGDARPFFADITIRHPTNDNAELLWHCGPFPASLAKIQDPKPQVIGDKGQWEIKGGDITIVRMGALHGKYTMFADEARGTDGPKTNGTYLWIETDNWPKWERKFVTGPYIHHVTGAHGKYKAVIGEALKYAGDIAPDSADA